MGLTISKRLIQLNQNILKHNKLIKITNERIDILAKNVSNSFNTVHKILDKLVDAQANMDLHSAILWNLDQLNDNTAERLTTFKFSELTITLLESGTLNAELINIQSIDKIVSEGLKSFPQLEFPLNIHRYQLSHIVKILKIQRIARHKFLMIIPLTHRTQYSVFSLIPHPVQLDSNTLALPELKDILLVDHNSYLITTKINMYTISPDHHLLLDVEPIYDKTRTTCEWEGFKKNTTAMLTSV